jgi:hypothetical protein
MTVSVRTKALRWLALLGGWSAACVNGDTVRFESDPLGVVVQDAGWGEPPFARDAAFPQAWVDTGMAPDAAGDPAQDGGENTPHGYGKIRIYRQRSDAQPDAGVLVTAYFTREVHQSCVVRQTLGACRVEQCAFTANPALLSPGSVLVEGSGPCALSAQSAVGYASCQARELWNIGAPGQTLRVHGSGAEFPAFVIEIAAPSSYALSEPQGSGLFGRRPLAFRWAAEAVGEMEIVLGQRSGCNGDFPQPTRLVCTVPAQEGAFELTPELLSALDDVHCLTATFQQRVTATQRIGAYRLDTSVELPYLTSFELAERDGGSCEGAHAPCGVFAGDEPSRCRLHGCSWQSGACVGSPHPCGNVTLDECASDAGTHPGCAASAP